MDGEELKDVMNNSVWEQDSAQQVVMFGQGVRTCHTSSQQREEGQMGRDKTQIWNHGENARKMYYLEAKQILSFSSCLSLSSSLKLKKRRGKKWTVLSEAWERDPLSPSPLSLPDCLSFQPPLSRDAETPVSPGYCYEFFHCYQPTTLLPQSWMNGTHGDGCNSLLLARYLAESHNVSVIEVELLKRSHTKSWKFSDKHEKRSGDEKHRGTPGSSQANQQPSALLHTVSPEPQYLLHYISAISAGFMW